MKLNLNRYVDHQKFLDYYAVWQKAAPDEVADAFVYMNDTLEMCWRAAADLFEDRATPEHALAMYDRLINRIERAKKR